MHEIQIIDLRGQFAAIVAGETTIIATHVPVELVAHVQAKALYALQIAAGELPGPYTDAGAERYARTAASRAASWTAARPPARLPPRASAMNPRTCYAPHTSGQASETAHTPSAPLWPRAAARAVARLLATARGHRIA